ncbi:MAG: TerD family protein [Synergistaceae bacterium]|nr:TerD family protein [Synergistaceae bacterium]
MTELQKGCRDKLDKYINPAESFIVSLKISGPSTYDFSCFGVDADNKLSDERYMIFYNQTSSPEGAIIYNAAGFNIDLSKLPYSINRLVFTASIDGSGSMGEITSHAVTISQNNNAALSMNLSGQDFHNERAIISIEIYHKDTSWRIAAVANGFNGGLSDLLKFYGGTEAEQAPETTHVTQTQPKHHEPEREPERDNAPIPVVTRRVELKKGVKVSLDKKIASKGEIVINLNWKHAASTSGLFSIRKVDKSKSIDLDIGCLYELSDGKRGSIQALGNKFGSLNNAPYISLDKDDRTGDAPEGENLRVNTAKIAEIRRILVYTFIYEGVNNWQEADGVITIKCPGTPEVIIKLDEYDTNKIMCALAMLENVNNETFSVEKIIRFFDGHISLDEAFNWGLKWVHGTKSLQVPAI